ncbi:MAG: hypothetical protein M5R38_10770 [Candidatus Methylomirabilis sp.]|nr:hypothetical protein [Candidatus Methylomirabilis sp.]
MGMALITVTREVAPGSLRVLYLLADQTGCGWYRCLLPGIYLRNLYGLDTRAAVSLSDEVRAFARDADIIVCQRQALRRGVEVCPRAEGAGKDDHL